MSFHHSQSKCAPHLQKAELSNVQLPGLKTRERSHLQPGGRRNHRDPASLKWDMLVPRRVTKHQSKQPILYVTCMGRFHAQQSPSMQTRSNTGSYFIWKTSILCPPRRTQSSSRSTPCHLSLNTDTKTKQESCHSGRVVMSIRLYRYKCTKIVSKPLLWKLPRQNVYPRRKLERIPRLAT